MDTFALSRLQGRLLTHGRTFAQKDALYFNWGGNTLKSCFRGTMNYDLSRDITRAVKVYQQEIGDERTPLLRFTPISPIGGLGADGHPGREPLEKMAEELTEHIRGMEQ